MMSMIVLFWVRIIDGLWQQVRDVGRVLGERFEGTPLLAHCGLAGTKSGEPAEVGRGVRAAVAGLAVELENMTCSCCEQGS